VYGSWKEALAKPVSWDYKPPIIPHCSNPLSQTITLPLLSMESAYMEAKRREGSYAICFGVDCRYMHAPCS